MNDTTDPVAPEQDTYACIIIGDEVLGGYVIECNLIELIHTLRPLGYTLQEVRIVSDELNALSKTISELKKIYTIVITIGGLGATHDDRTMEAYAKSFQQKLILHKEMYDFLHLKPRPTADMQKAVERMSQMPQETEIIHIDNTWPIIKLENCFALPGLPSICKLTIKKLAKILPKKSDIFYQECFVNIREHQYFVWLSYMAKKWTDISIGSYPIHEQGNVVSKISITGKNSVQVNQCYQEIQNYFTELNALQS